MSPHAEFQAQWRDRLASGAKPASRSLAAALREDARRLPAVAALAQDPLPLVRLGAMRALAELAATHPALVAPYGREVVEALAAPEPDAQAAALDALAGIAPLASAEVALALPLVADVLRTARRPALREAAARSLGQLGMLVPQAAPQAAARLVQALDTASRPRLAPEAREILAALQDLVPHLAPAARARLAPRVQTLRGHPNLQVRERAGQLARQLSG